MAPRSSGFRPVRRSITVSVGAESASLPAMPMLKLKVYGVGAPGAAYGDCDDADEVSATILIGPEPSLAL